MAVSDLHDAILLRTGRRAWVSDATGTWVAEIGNVNPDAQPGEGAFRGEGPTEEAAMEALLDALAAGW